MLTALAAATIAAQQPPPRTAPGSRLSEAQLIAALGGHLDSLAAQDRFSGVVVLARNGTPVFQRSSGMADREAGARNAVDTRFNVASINKAFTAMAIRQLADAGKLALTDTLIEHLPDYPNPDVAKRVTIAQLLGHTSGIGGNIFEAPPGGSRDDLRRTADFLALFARGPLQFEPGSRRQYSNAGYIVLGAVIERLSGMSYYDYVRTRVFEPPGMTSTGSYAKDSLPANTAVGYTRGGPGTEPQGPPQPNTELLPGCGSSAGGGYSTAGDLLRFARALRDGRIAGGPPAGLGVAGGAPGINAILEADIAGYDLVVLANLDPPVAENVGRQVREWLGVGGEQDGRRVLRRPAAVPEPPGGRMADVDRVRLAEAFRLAAAVDDQVWEGWRHAPFAVLLVTPEREFLVRHPAPSADFTRLEFDSLLGSDVWVRPRTHRPDLLATFPAIAGSPVPTIVVGRAEQTAARTSTPWVVTLLHEHFHQLQYSQPTYYTDVAALDLSGGDQTGMWMLTYPFPYQRTEVGERFAAASRMLAAALDATDPRPALTRYLDARAQLVASLSAPDGRYLGSSCGRKVSLGTRSIASPVSPSDINRPPPSRR